MTLEALKKLVDAAYEIDPKMEVMTTDPERCNIISGTFQAGITEVMKVPEFAWSEYHRCEFPIGYKFFQIE